MNDKGVTLIELIFVIAIIVIVVSIGVPDLMQSYERKALEADEIAIFTLNDATESYALIGGFSLDHTATDFVFSDCSVSGTLSSELMINELMENGFLISRPRAESENGAFVWNTGARRWELSTGS